MLSTLSRIWPLPVWSVIISYGKTAATLDTICYGPHESAPCCGSASIFNWDRRLPIHARLEITKGLRNAPRMKCQGVFQPHQTSACRIWKILYATILEDSSIGKHPKDVKEHKYQHPAVPRIHDRIYCIKMVIADRKQPGIREHLQTEPAIDICWLETGARIKEKQYSFIIHGCGNHKPGSTDNIQAQQRKTNSYKAT